MCVLFQSFVWMVAKHSDRTRCLAFSILSDCITILTRSHSRHFRRLRASESGLGLLKEEGNSLAIRQ